MAGFNVTVNPGPAQQITGAVLNHGSSIYNMDQENSVWISSSQTVSPSNGILVPAFGSVEWTGDKNAWVCVDDGVTTPVILNFSDDANNLQNPLGIAVATALALEERGVYSALIFDLLAENVDLSATSLSCDVAKYNTVIVECGHDTFFTPFQTFSAYVGSGFSGIVEQPIYGDIFILGDRGPWSPALPASMPAVTIPTNGNTLFLQGVDWQPGLTVSVYGTNRVVDATEGNSLSRASGSGAYFSTTSAPSWSKGTNVSMLSYILQGSLFQGPAWLQMQVSGSSMAGYLFMQVAGHNYQLPIVDTSELIVGSNGAKYITKMIAIPGNINDLVYAPENASPTTGNIIIALTPAR